MSKVDLTATGDGTDCSDVTREGITVRAGQVWRDLDVRTMGGKRHCRVERVEGGAALMRLSSTDGEIISTRTTRVSIHRMHKSSTGWALVKDVQEAMK